MWVFVYPLIALPLFWRLFRRIKMLVGEYIGALWPAISGCILMVEAVESIQALARPTMACLSRSDIGNSGRGIGVRACLNFDASQTLACFYRIDQEFA